MITVTINTEDGMKLIVNKEQVPSENVGFTYEVGFWLHNENNDNVHTLTPYQLQVLRETLELISKV